MKGTLAAPIWIWIPAVLYIASWVAAVVYILVAKLGRLLHRSHRVPVVRPGRGNAWMLTTEPVGHPGLRCSAGQFGWLTFGAAPFRAGEHPFSFSSSVANTGSLQLRVPELGAFPRTARGTRPGALTPVGGPHDDLTVDRYPHAAGFVFVAGGAGIAPIISMLRTLADRHDVRPIHLVYCNQHWKNVLFREELETLSGKLALSVTHVLEDPPPSWTGETGRVTRDLLGRALPRPRRPLVYFLCGPRALTDPVQRDLRALGVPLAHIHSERFEMV